MGILSRLFGKNEVLQSPADRESPRANQGLWETTSVSLGTVVSSESQEHVLGTLESLMAAARVFKKKDLGIQIVCLCTVERSDLSEAFATPTDLDVELMQPSQWKEALPHYEDTGYFDYVNALLTFLWGDVILLLQCGYKFSDSCLRGSYKLSIGRFGKNPGRLLIPSPKRESPLPRAAAFSRMAKEYGILMFAADGWSVELKASGKYTRTGEPRSVTGGSTTFYWVLAAVAAYYQEDKPKKRLWVDTLVYFSIEPC